MASIDSRLKRLEQHTVNQQAPELTLILNHASEQERQAAEEKDRRFPQGNIKLIHQVSEGVRP